MERRRAAGVRLLGAKGSIKAILRALRGGEVVGSVAGVSHARRAERSNLARQFASLRPGTVDVAVLHANVGAVPGLEDDTP